MSYTYHGTTGLIALPGRSMQTFPSGMIRVDRSYLCRKGLEDNFRDQFEVGNDLPLDDGKPAIDGLKIYPEVQEIYRDDGFVEFRASAYGRKNLTGKVEYRYRQGIAFASVGVEQFSFNYQENTYILGVESLRNPIPNQLLFRNAIAHRCIPIDEAPEENRTLQGDIFFADNNEPISSRVFSRSQLAAQLFPNFAESEFYKYLNPFVDEAQLNKSISVGGIEIKTFGSFQEIREVYTVRVASDIGLGRFRQIRIGTLASEVEFERITLTSSRKLNAYFKKPINSETLEIRIVIRGDTEEVVFDKQGISYGGTALSTGYKGVRIFTSLSRQGDVQITFDSQSQELGDTLRITLTAEGENELTAPLATVEWQI